MCAVGLHSSRSRTLARVAGARKAEFPPFIEPCDPTLRDTAPSGAGWLYEIKADGYRAQVHVRQGKSTVYSRTGRDRTDQFSTIAAAASQLPASEAVIDGEAVVYGTTGLARVMSASRVICDAEILVAARLLRSWLLTERVHPV